LKRVQSLGEIFEDKITASVPTTTTTTVPAISTTTLKDATNNTIINNILAAIQVQLQSVGIGSTASTISTTTTTTTTTISTTATSSTDWPDLYVRFCLTVFFLVFIVVGVASIVWYKVRV
jgi:hypothetical protein